MLPEPMEVPGAAPEGVAEVAATGNRAQRRAEKRAKRAGGVDLKRPEPPVDPLEGLPTVGLGWCWSEKRGVSGFWHKSIVETLVGLSGKVRFADISVESGPFLTRSRSKVAEAFLRGKCDYLLMTDTDAVFGPGDVLRLLEAEKPIAGALVYTMVTGVQPFASIMLRDETTGDYTTAPEDFLPEIPEPPAAPEALPEDAEEREAAIREYQAELSAYEVVQHELLAPRQVGALGCTLTLYRRDVVEAVRSVYNLPFETVGDVGEDITFCDRALEMGFETWLVPEARIGHSVAVVI